MSFSAEIKDFIGGMQSGQKIFGAKTDKEYKEAQTEATKAKTLRDNDPETLATQAEQARATLAVTQDKLKSSAASRAHTGAATSLTQERLKQLRAGGAGGGSGLFPTGAINPGASTMQPTPGGGGALPIGPSTLQDETDMYADGGLVPEEDEEEPLVDPDAGETGAVPINAPMAPAAPTDVSARRREPGVPKGLEGVISPALVHDATKAGMMFGINEYGLNNAGAIRTPAAQAKARLFAQGHGGLTEQEMQAAKKAVDPEGKLTESQRNMAALGSVYQFWANKGEGQKAEKVAFQMLQHYRNAAQRYAAISAKAAEGGNVDLATKAAMKAYANVPDGNDLELMANPDGGIMYAVTGPDGEVVTKGIATPQQLAASAMGLATGGFDKAILAAAGAREAPKGAVKAGGGKPQTASDRKTEAEGLTGEIGKLKAQDEKINEKSPDKKMPDEYWDGVQNAATHIRQQNPKMTDNEAVAATHRMLSTKDPEKPDFKVTPGEDGVNRISFGKKLSFDLDDQQLDAVATSLAARAKLESSKRDKQYEEDEKPSFGDRFKKASDSIDNAALNVARSAGGAVSAVGDVAGRLFRDTSPERKKADEEAAALPGVLADKFGNKGAIPLDDNDRPL